METVNVDIKSDEKASRLELIIRIFYAIPLYIVMVILSIVAGIVWLINILTVLILGKRVAIDWVSKYIKYFAKFCAYWMLCTDERPPIMPE